MINKYFYFDCPLFLVNLLPVSSLADCRVFLASAATTLLTESVNFRATSGLRSH